MMIRKLLRDSAFKACKTFWKMQVSLPRPCPICGSEAVLKEAYQRHFLQCTRCEFSWTGDFPSKLASYAFGVSGSWGGIGEGGASDHYLATLLHELNLTRKLIIGIGATRAPYELAKAGIPFVGSDLSKSVISHLRKDLASAEFIFPDALGPSYDGIVACEVLEHFTNPKRQLADLLARLPAGGLMCGTTDLKPLGESIVEERDANDTYPGYMSYWGHISYWTDSAMKICADEAGLQFLSVPIVCPGAHVRDVKFNALFPRKRAFFFSDDISVLEKIDLRLNTQRELPIDNARYWKNFE